MAEVRPRIVGTEMEWPISVRLEGETTLRPLDNKITGDYRTEMIACLPDGLESVGLSTGMPFHRMLSNGGKYYPDVTDRVEYATPENTSFAGCVTSELAGEYIVMHGLGQIVAQQDRKIQEAWLQKQVVDDSRNGWGYHVNLSADRRALASLEEGTALLATHLATSLALLGAGKLYETKIGNVSNVSYSLGQKVLCLTSDYSSGTTGTSKPLINTRDEPHAPKEYFRRIHITGTDPHVSPWASLMMLGTSSLMLSASEQGRGRALGLASVPGSGGQPALYASRVVTQDLDFSAKLKLKDGRSIKAADVQELLIEVADKTERTDEEDNVLEEWKRAVADLQRDPFLLKDRSDAIAKLDLLFAQQARDGLTGFNHPTLRLCDLRYGTLLRIQKDVPKLNGSDVHELHRRTMAYKLRTARFRKEMPAYDDIVAAVINPPTTTRAYARGNAIRDLYSKIKYADWTIYKLEGASEPVKLENPYAGTLADAVALENS